MSALWDFLPGFISAGVNTGKGNKCTAVCETGDIPDLSHKLGAKGWTDPVHRHDGGIFRQGGCCLIHLLAEGFHRSGCCVQHRHSLTHQHPGVVIFGEYRNQVRGETVYFLRFFGTEVIPSASAPVSVVFRKGIQGLAADTVHMPVGMDYFWLLSLRVGLSKKALAPGQVCSMRAMRLFFMAVFSLPVQSTGYHTNAGGFNLHKTNVANE